MPRFPLSPALVLAMTLPYAAHSAERQLPPATNIASVAWDHLMRQPTAPQQPPAKGKETKKEEVSQWMDSEVKRLRGVAEEARNFTKQFPADSNLPFALKIEEEALFAASQLGDIASRKELEELDRIRLQDSGLPLDDRLHIRMRQVQQTAQAKASEVDAALKSYLEGARALTAEFPGRMEPYQMLLEVADSVDEAQSRVILDEVIKGDAPEQVKGAAQAVLHRLDALGKPLDLKFTALDGREIDLSTYKGHIVLIDFWALWNSPSLQRLPKLKEASEKLQDLHFDVIGINCDSDKTAVEKYLKESGLNWPQYFDGRGLNNALARQYGVRSLPTFWLVDQQGVLRDLHAENELANKVQALLDEKK